MRCAECFTRPAWRPPRERGFMERPPSAFSRCEVGAQSRSHLSEPNSAPWRRPGARRDECKVAVAVVGSAVTRNDESDRRDLRRFRVAGSRSSIRNGPAVTEAGLAGRTRSSTSDGGLHLCRIGLTSCRSLGCQCRLLSARLRSKPMPIHSGSCSGDDPCELRACCFVKAGARPDLSGKRKAIVGDVGAQARDSTER